MRKIYLIVLMTLCIPCTLYALKCELWPIFLDDTEAASLQTFVVSDFRPNDINNSVSLYENTYFAGDCVEPSFYGRNDGYLSVVVADMGWAGLGFFVSDYQAVEELRQEISSHLDEFYLHFAIKSSDAASHTFTLLDDNESKFVIGTTAPYGGTVLGDFLRDGAWHEFSIPLSSFSNSFNTPIIESNNTTILSVFSEPIFGAQLNLDAIFIYRNSLPIRRSLVIEGDGTLGSVVVNSSTSSNEYHTLPYVTSLYEDTLVLEAIPNYGYQFAGWSDGVIDNPRRFYLDRDTTFSAQFEKITSGSCGPNLVWNYSDDTLFISGYGTMDDFPSWGLWKDSIISIELPDGLTSIGRSAFKYFSHLESLFIPSTVVDIKSSIVSNCSALTSLSVDSRNPIYDSRDGCNAIIKTASNSLLYGCATTSIPNSVTSIRSEAFRGSSLTSIVIPASVNRIATSAFLQCYNLYSIVVESENSVYDSRNNCNAIILSDSNTLVIGCDNSIIPNSVTSVGDSAFYGCNMDTIIIPLGVRTIGMDAFHDVPFRKLVLGKDVSSIADFAFSCIVDSHIYSYSVVAPQATKWAFFDPTILIPFIGNDAPYVVVHIPYGSDYSAWKWYDSSLERVLFQFEFMQVAIETIAPDSVILTWEPVDLASQYQLHIYTDSTSTIALDTTLQIDAIGLNGEIVPQLGTSAPHRVNKIILDGGGTIIVVPIEPSIDGRYEVIVSTESGERIDVHYDMKVYSGDEVIREDHGTFVFNDVQPDGIQNTLVPSLPTGIYDLYGHRYSAEAWETLPAGVYVVREEDRVEKVMKMRKK